MGDYMSCLTIDDIYKAKDKLTNYGNGYYFHPPKNCNKVYEIPKQLGLCPICVNKCYEYLSVIK